MGHSPGFPATTDNKASARRHGRFHLYSRQCALKLLVALFVVAAAAVGAQEKPYEPVPGQAGKDAVWVPTPFATIEKMLDLAELTPQDFVVDLGSGDGRAVIAAAKRGAQAVGVEFEEKLVLLSRELAKKAGVADKATFVQHDMFTYDISKATVLPLFLLPEHFAKLTPKFLALKPGARIVINTFRIPNWEPDETAKAEGDCSHWCTALLYIVPAKVAGSWQLPEGELRLTQEFQKVSGTLASGGKRIPIKDARLRGDNISFSIGRAKYTGRVDGNTMSGSIAGKSTSTWTAVKK
jgi:SAM-dependent methyltransferase